MTDRGATVAHWPMAVVAATLTLTTPIAVWWLAGDQTEIAAELEPDYLVRPIESIRSWRRSSASAAPSPSSSPWR